MKPAKVGKTVLLLKSDYDKFREVHPGHGSFSWFVQTALRKYNELNVVSADELVELAVKELTLK